MRFWLREHINIKQKIAVLCIQERIRSFHLAVINKQIPKVCLCLGRPHGVSSLYCSGYSVYSSSLRPHIPYRVTDSNNDLRWNFYERGPPSPRLIWSSPAHTVYRPHWNSKDRRASAEFPRYLPCASTWSPVSELFIPLLCLAPRVSWRQGRNWIEHINRASFANLFVENWLRRGR